MLLIMLMLCVVILCCLSSPGKKQMKGGIQVSDIAAKIIQNIKNDASKCALNISVYDVNAETKLRTTGLSVRLLDVQSINKGKQLAEAYYLEALYKQSTGEYPLYLFEPAFVRLLSKDRAHLQMANSKCVVVMDKSDINTPQTIAAINKPTAFVNAANEQFKPGAAGLNDALTQLLAQQVFIDAKLTHTKCAGKSASACMPILLPDYTVVSCKHPQITHPNFQYVTFINALAAHNIVQGNQIEVFEMYEKIAQICINNNIKLVYLPLIGGQLFGGDNEVIVNVITAIITKYLREIDIEIRILIFDNNMSRQQANEAHIKRNCADYQITLK